MAILDGGKWARASFRAWSDELPPDVIRDALGLDEGELRPKGVDRAGRPAPGRKAHVFRLASGLAPSEPLERHLSVLCDRIEPLASKIDGLRDRCDFDLFCGFGSLNGQGGFTLSPALLRRLAALNIAVSLDLYPPSGLDT